MSSKPLSLIYLLLLILNEKLIQSAKSHFVALFVNYDLTGNRNFPKRLATSNMLSLPLHRCNW